LELNSAGHWPSRIKFGDPWLNQRHVFGTIRNSLEVSNNINCGKDNAIKIINEKGGHKI